MEKIFTVGFSKESIINLGFPNLEIPNLVDNDTEYHNFIIKIFQENEIDKLIFDLSTKPVQSLKLAYHIRLSLIELKEKSLIPILFSATQSFESIIGNCGKWIQIFSTNGTYFTSLNLAKIDVLHIEPLKAIEYKIVFLDNIQILPGETEGKHSIANQWGAFAMDKASNTNVLFYNDNLKQTFHKLYFKYIQAFQFDYDSLDKATHIKGNIPVGTANTIEAKNKKILLIDDEAEKGWELVLKKVFKNGNFQVINEKVADYNSFSENAKKLIKEGEFDLFLVDLRLNGVQEEEFTPIENFSGTNVLSEIKNQNKGNQVIIFTASNKAWNIKPLLDFGADAFYIKESPEYMFSSKVSESNYLSFKSNVETCFERNYLKNISSKICELKNNLKNLKNIYNQKFLDEIEILLDQSFDMHYNAKDEKQYAYAYVTLYMIIEILNKEFVEEDENKFWCIDAKKLEKWKKIDNNIVFEISEDKYRSEANKILGIAIQKLDIETTNIILLTTNSCVTRRSVFIHPKATNIEGKLMKPDGKIYTNDGFIELFNLIELLLNNLK
jgi:CheY-like chemotaxis protein